MTVGYCTWVPEFGAFVPRSLVLGEWYWSLWLAWILALYTGAMTVKDAKNCRKEYAKHRPEQEREIEMQSQQIARKRKRNTNYCLDRSASLIVTKDDLLNYLLRCMFDPAGHKGGPIWLPPCSKSSDCGGVFCFHHIFNEAKYADD